MGWLVEALANVFLELLGDLMAWTVNLVTTLHLDIGMDLKDNGAVKMPALGTLINPMAARGNLLESTFPQAASFTKLFLILGVAIVFFLCITKLMIAMGGPFTKSEEPGTIVIRTMIALVGTVYSYSIFVLLESLFNSIYGKFMRKYKDITRDVDNYSLVMQDTNHIDQYQNGGVTGTQDAFKMIGKDLLKNYRFGEGLAVTIIAIVLFSILLVSFMRLVLEIYERYVMLGVLFYTAPLAFSTIVSKQMNVFGSWIQMVLSEFVVMCSNLFFTGVFISAWHGILATDKSYLFGGPKTFITTMFLMISWLIIGQQFDQHLKTLGLSTAQTGQGLGGAVATGLGTAATFGYMAWDTVRGAGRGAYNVATGQTKWQRSIESGSGPLGQFFNGGRVIPQQTKNYADNLLSAAGTAGSRESRQLANMSDNSRGDKLLNAGIASMGESNFQRALAEQTGGAAIGDIKKSSIAFKDGMLTGKTEEGKPFAMQFDRESSGRYNTSVIGNGWSRPMTKAEAKEKADEYAGQLNDRVRSIDGQPVKWSRDLNDPSKVSAFEWDKENRSYGGIVEKRDVPGVAGDKGYWTPGAGSNSGYTSSSPAGEPRNGASVTSSVDAGHYSSEKGYSIEFARGDGEFEEHVPVTVPGQGAGRGSADITRYSGSAPEFTPPSPAVDASSVPPAGRGTERPDSRGSTETPDYRGTTPEPAGSDRRSWEEKTGKKNK